ncbi:hypothetical protein PMIN01_01255 [Paraphaeosphaeria minitans]|uniref:Uncharacterized protein n=1 Tax=Paraphaeosphaeria minitans TaxID=565426 RepID=A0A9P6KX21_9PLEO|nr:hypothetical protein PMIN01_01255 [Paraphaeosphaeria minitans]
MLLEGSPDLRVLEPPKAIHDIPILRIALTLFIIFDEAIAKHFSALHDLLVPLQHFHQAWRARVGKSHHFRAGIRDHVDTSMLVVPASAVAQEYGGRPLDRCAVCAED